MQTKDHLYIGKYAVDNSIPIKFSHRTAFIAGCVEPDINPVSYIKGSLSKKTLGGHNYDNSRKYMARTIQSLSCKATWNTLDYFYFGRVIHYVIDSFTYPHNNVFKGSIRNHSRFEAELHQVVTSYIGSENKYPLYNLSITDFTAFITSFHSRYIRSCGSLETDCYYISCMTAIIARLLPQKEASTLPVATSAIKASRANI